MGAQRVTIKRATLCELERLLLEGDGVAALAVVRECLDSARQLELQRCKAEAYRRFRAGRCDYKTYRELWEYADSFQR